MSAVMQEVKERPIICSGPMVKAILEGRKTQTRRVIKPQPERDPFPCHYVGSGWSLVNAQDSRNCSCVEIRCPYAGDRLWVRETWANADRMYQSHESDVAGVVAYYADESAIQFDARSPRQIPDYDLETWNWGKLKRKPSIFMPRWASRITLEITDVRVERLQEISCPDVMAEGSPVPMREYSNPDLGVQCVSAKEWYQQGWDALNAKRGYSWESNPWVWVLEFKKL